MKTKPTCLQYKMILEISSKKFHGMQSDATSAEAPVLVRGRWAGGRPASTTRKEAFCLGSQSRQRGKGQD